MSKENGEEPLDAPPEEIIDEDGDVDKAIKRSIIKGRNQVDETELALFRDSAINPEVNLSRAQQIYIYGNTVKLYLRRIEPIMKTKNIPENKKYYRELEIGQFTLTPPEWDGYDFTMVQRSDLSDQRLRQAVGLPRQAEIPKPVTKRLTGLKDVIESDPIMSHTWEVCVSRDGPPSKWKYVYPRTEQPLPKSVYENAVREADMFLQEAGIGLDTDVGGTEMIREFDMSGDEQSARYAVGDYQSNPDL